MYSASTLFALQLRQEQSAAFRRRCDQLRADQPVVQRRRRQRGAVRREALFITG